MTNEITLLMIRLEAIKHQSENGGEFWTARELMTVLNYMEELFKNYQ
ncbi:MAG: hypothetical protein Q7V63_03250 [Gammaproteobacteria bacterium]|nr:hypothetical protein [Gammaproteobacteria bacterium]